MLGRGGGKGCDGRKIGFQPVGPNRPAKTTGSGSKLGPNHTPLDFYRCRESQHESCVNPDYGDS